LEPNWLNQTARRNALSWQTPGFQWGVLLWTLPLDELSLEDRSRMGYHKDTATCPCRFEATCRHRPLNI